MPTRRLESKILKLFTKLGVASIGRDDDDRIFFERVAMHYRLLTVVFLLMFVIGCGEKVEPSKELIKLKGMSAGDVAFTYDAIVAMSDTELDAEIVSLRERLRKKRAGLPPSAAGASVGGGGGDEKLESDEDPDPDADLTVEYMALPLEVMLQEQERRK